MVRGCSHGEEGWYGEVVMRGGGMVRGCSHGEERW